MFIRQDRRQHENRPRDPSLAKLDPLGDRSDAEPPRLERLERASDLDGAKSVAISFDDGKQRNAGALRERGPIASQRAEVDFDPGARMSWNQLT